MNDQISESASVIRKYPLPCLHVIHTPYTPIYSDIHLNYMKHIVIYVGAEKKGANKRNTFSSLQEFKIHGRKLTFWGKYTIQWSWRVNSSHVSFYWAIKWRKIISMMKCDWAGRHWFGIFIHFKGKNKMTGDKKCERMGWSWFRGNSSKSAGEEVGQIKWSDGQQKCLQSHW